MSTLGEILSQLHDESQVFAILAEAGDIKSIAGLQDAARRSGQDPCEWAIDAVHNFTEMADNEAWVQLMGRIQNADSPGSACLSEIIAWSLER
ncbi:MAG TPA: hypothetical protein VLT91_06130 [Rhizomicrobium sp.]|nr:hypothetical protein [Rhizomicrobium sp.]